MSDSKFGTSGVDARDKKLSKWMEPMSVQRAIIQSVEYITSKNGTPGMQLLFTTYKKYDELKGPNGESPYGQKMEETWWLSDAALQYTKERLVLIADKLGFREELDKATAAAQSNQDFVEKSAELLVGIDACWLVGGEQVWLKDSETGKISEWRKPTLYAFGFVAPATKEGHKHLSDRKEELGDRLLTENPAPEGANVSSSTGGAEVDDIDW